MRRFVEFLLTPAKIFKTLLLWATNQHHLRVIISIFYFIGTCMKIWEAVLQSLSGRKRYINLHFFCNFSLQSFGSVKLTAIPGITANPTFCFPKTCNLSAVNKKTFSGSSDETFEKFWVYVPKRVKFWEFWRQQKKLKNLLCPLWTYWRTM